MQTISKTRTSKYLKTLLNPASGPCHIPDDIATRCTLRSETTTYNIVAPASGQGIFTFFPNSPFGWCGYHYTYNGIKYVYDSTTGPLDTAQNLNQNYNYSRLVSQILTLRSSTLPAGVYALNGTFNAITYDGCISEANLPTTQYGQLLSLNSDVIDKVGNVLVGDGVAILSLPNRFDVPFCRMNDPAPSTGSTGAIFQSSIVDSTSSLRYEMQLAPIAIGAMPAYNTTLASINVDNVRSVSVKGAIPLINSSRVNSTNTMTYTVLYLDFTGATIYQEVKAVTLTIDPNFNGTGYNGGCSILIDSSFSSTMANGSHMQPVAAISFSIQNIVQPGSGTWNVNEFGFAPFNANSSAITLNVDAISAAFPGMNSPVTIVAYQGLAAGSVLTLSGVSNYELVPNPSLKKNLPTSYGKHDPNEINYVKMVLAHRQELGVKTVFALPEYKQLLTRLEEFYNLDSNTYAEAFDWGKLLKTIKDIAVPALSTVFPQFSPLIGAGSALGDELLKAFSASGAAIAASGTPIARASVVTPGVDLVDLRNYAMDNWDIVNMDLQNLTYNSQMLYTKKLYVGERLSSEGPPRGVLFPTITMKNNTLISHMIYLAVPGNWSTRLPMNVRDNYSETANGKRIWGIANTYLGHIMTNQDITLLPILSIQGGYAIIPDEAPILEGTSCVSAILCADRGDFQGIPPALVTGNAKLIEGRYIVMPNPAQQMKRQIAAQKELKFIGADLSGPILFISHVIDELKGLETKNKVFDVVKNDQDYSRTVNLCADEDQMQQWQDLSAHISTLDDGFRKLIHILNWVNRNGLADMLYNFAETDPDGNRLYKTIAPLTAEYKTKNPESKTPYEAQRAKAERISANLRKQYGDKFTPEWVEQHGYRGPTSEEISALTSQVAKPEKIEALIAATIKNNGGDKLSADQKSEIEVAIRNKGKGLNPDELMKALGRGGTNLGSKAENFIINSGIKDEELKQKIRDEIMTSGKGLSADRLRELMGVNRVEPRKPIPAVRKLIGALQAAPKTAVQQQVQAPVPKQRQLQQTTPLQKLLMRAAEQES